MFPRSDQEEVIQFYLKLVEPFVSNLSLTDQTNAKLWLDKIKSSKDTDVAIEYLKVLALLVEKEQLVGVFSGPPKDGKLEKLPFDVRKDVEKCGDSPGGILGLELGRVDGLPPTGRASKKKNRTALQKLRRDSEFWGILNDLFGPATEKKGRKNIKFIKDLSPDPFKYSSEQIQRSEEKEFDFETRTEQVDDILRPTWATKLQNNQAVMKAIEKKMKYYKDKVLDITSTKSKIFYGQNEKSVPLSNTSEVILTNESKEKEGSVVGEVKNDASEEKEENYEPPKITKGRRYDISDGRLTSGKAVVMSLDTPRKSNSSCTFDTITHGSVSTVTGCDSKLLSSVCDPKSYYNKFLEREKKKYRANDSQAVKRPENIVTKSPLVKIEVNCPFLNKTKGRSEKIETPKDTSGRLRNGRVSARNVKCFYPEKKTKNKKKGHKSKHKKLSPSLEYDLNDLDPLILEILESANLLQLSSKECLHRKKSKEKHKPFHLFEEGEISKRSSQEELLKHPKFWNAPDLDRPKTRKGPRRPQPPSILGEPIPSQYSFDSLQFQSKSTNIPVPDSTKRIPQPGSLTSECSEMASDEKPLEEPSSSDKDEKHDAHSRITKSTSTSKFVFSRSSTEYTRSKVIPTFVPVRPKYVPTRYVMDPEYVQDECYAMPQSDYYYNPCDNSYELVDAGETPREVIYEGEEWLDLNLVNPENEDEYEWMDVSGLRSNHVVFPDQQVYVATNSRGLAAGSPDEKKIYYHYGRLGDLKHEWTKEFAPSVKDCCGVSPPKRGPVVFKSGLVDSLLEEREVTSRELIKLRNRQRSRPRSPLSEGPIERRVEESGHESPEKVDDPMCFCKTDFVVNRKLDSTIGKCGCSSEKPEIKERFMSLAGGNPWKDKYDFCSKKPARDKIPCPFCKRLFDVCTSDKSVENCPDAVSIGVQPSMILHPSQRSCEDDYSCSVASPRNSDCDVSYKLKHCRKRKSRKCKSSQKKSSCSKPSSSCCNKTSKSTCYASRSRTSCCSKRSDGSICSRRCEVKPQRYTPCVPPPPPCPIVSRSTFRTTSTCHKPSSSCAPCPSITKFRKVPSCRSITSVTYDVPSVGCEKHRNCRSGRIRVSCKECNTKRLTIEEVLCYLEYLKRELCNK